MKTNQLFWQQEKNCAALKAKYAKKGVEVVTFCVISEKKPRISSVILDFTPEVWVDLLNTQGELLGTCCTQISYLRDLLASALRNDQRMPVRDVYEFAKIWTEHCGMTINKFKFTPNDPLSRIVEIWRIIQKDADFSLSTNVLPTEPQELIDTIVSGCKALILPDPRSDPETQFRCQADRFWYFSQMWPAMLNLQAAIRQYVPESLEGWAVCRQGVVIQQQRGLAVCHNKEVAEDLLKTYQRWGIAKKHLSVRRIRLTVTNGVEYL